jgi:hypothetical protein
MYSLTVVPEAAWISCTVYFAAGNAIRGEAFMDTLSVSVEVELSPKVANAQIGSTNVTNAMLASNAVVVVPCIPFEMISDSKLIWFGCMNRFLCDNAGVVRAGVPGIVVPATIVMWLRRMDSN